MYKFATRVVVESSMRCLEAAGFGVADVDVFVPHQANRRIIDHAARRLGLDEGKVFTNVDRYGNTSAGSYRSASTKPAGRPHPRQATWC